MFSLIARIDSFKRETLASASSSSFSKSLSTVGHVIIVFLVRVLFFSRISCSTLVNLINVTKPNKDALRSAQDDLEYHLHMEEVVKAKIAALREAIRVLAPAYERPEATMLLDVSVSLTERIKALMEQHQDRDITPKEMKSLVEASGFPLTKKYGSNAASMVHQSLRRLDDKGYLKRSKSGGRTLYRWKSGAMPQTRAS